MTQEQDKLIPIDAPRTDFEQFLSKDNKRVFFSGQFGIGKTFFLKEFFKSDKRKWEYDVYHLFPVNYQISSNENIVEFLKYDILVELLNKYPNAFESAEINGLGEKLRFFVAFCKDRGLVGRVSKVAIKSLFALTPDPIFTPLSRLGRSLNDLGTIKKEFQESKAEKLSGDKNAIDEFSDQIETKVDIVATDYVSQLLREKIETLKKNKRSVLILDDFDRLDPEHTFRLLNIFSVHTVHIKSDEQNKFGFDHIIIVGDIENLRNIFHHKYGAETDFWGYFDKFFTVEPYHFDNAQAITERIPYLLQHIQYEDQELKGALGDSGIIRLLLEEILLQASLVKAINLRQLYSPLKHPFPELREGGVYPRKMANTTYFVDPYQLLRVIDIGMKLLIAIYGGNIADFLKVLTKIKDNTPDVLSPGKQRLYSLIASPMLKRMIPLEDVGNELWLGKYTLVVVEDNSDGTGKGIRLKDGDHHHFFYDTLIKYVSRPEYAKQKLDDSGYL